MAGQREGNAPVTIYGGKGTRLHYHVKPKTTGTNNPVLDAEETFKQECTFFRDYMSKVTGTQLPLLYEIAFGWQGPGWKFLQATAMDGCAQLVLQSKASPGVTAPRLPHDFAVGAAAIQSPAVVVQEDE